MGSEWREVSSLGVLERLQIDASYRYVGMRARMVLGMWRTDVVKVMLVQD